MGCRLKCQHAFPGTLPACALKAPTVAAEEAFWVLNLCCLLLYGANLLVGSIFFPQHMNPIPFPDTAHVHCHGCYGMVSPPPAPPPSASGQPQPDSDS